MTLYDLSWSDLGDEYDIVCPRCGARAAVRRAEAPRPQPPGRAAQIALEWRMVCAACGLVRTDAAGASSGTPPWRFEPWYSADCCGHVLVARNARHLALLREHVAARLRGRTGPPWRNASLGSRLPRWMTAAGNREEVLRVIERLEAKR